MVDVHIQVTLTCDECGRMDTHDSYDQLVVSEAQDEAFRQLGWKEQGEECFCPECVAENESESAA